MTTFKIAAKPNSGAMQALEPHISRLYDKPGLSIMAVVEFRHDQRVQVAPGSDGDQSVTVKIIGCEVASQELEGVLRESQRALYVIRTARGTIDEDGAVDLGEETLRRTGGLMHAIETARLRAGLLHWTAYIAQVVAGSGKLNSTEMAHELDNVAEGLKAVLATAGEAPMGDD
jgi:hypothetical protein